MIDLPLVSTQILRGCMDNQIILWYLKQIFSWSYYHEIATFHPGHIISFHQIGCPSDTDLRFIPTNILPYSTFEYKFFWIRWVIIQRYPSYHHTVIHIFWPLFIEQLYHIMMWSSFGIVHWAHFSTNNTISQKYLFIMFTNTYVSVGYQYKTKQTNYISTHILLLIWLYMSFLVQA